MVADFFLFCFSSSHVSKLQDFFLSTPKHPFFLWLLNDRWDTFTRSSAFPPPSLSSNSTSTQVEGEKVDVAVGAHVEKPAFPKGPFSYSIEKDIDRYLQYKKDRSGNANKDKNQVVDDVIIELHEDLMHPLVDSTNSRLQSSCVDFKKAGAESVGSTLGENPVF